VALVAARILAGITWTASQDWQETARILERDLRITQAVFLCGLLLLVTYYSVSMGRNLKGLTLGYGIFLGLNIAELTIRGTLGQPFHATLMFLQPATYDAALCLWLASLWVKDPVAQQAPSPRLQQDYAHLVAATRIGCDAQPAMPARGVTSGGGAERRSVEPVHRTRPFSRTTCTSCRSASLRMSGTHRPG